MKWIIVALVVLWELPALASQGMGPGPGVKGYATGGGGPTIVAYFNTATSNNTTAYTSPTGTAMTKGTGTPGYTSDFTVDGGSYSAPYTGLHWLYRAGGNGYQFQIPTASNWSNTLGTMSFYWHASTITALSEFVETDGNSTPYFSFFNPTATSFEYRYMNSAIGATTTVNTTDWYWITVAWDYSGTRASIRVYDETTSTWITGNASTWVSATGLSGSAPTGSGSINFGNQNSYQNTQAFGQIMFSAGYQDDHFSKRTSTSP